jgi:hypothetical protein
MAWQEQGGSRTFRTRITPILRPHTLVLSKALPQTGQLMHLLVQIPVLPDLSRSKGPT